MRALVITAMGRPSAQAASQNPRPERDAPSFCDPWRKAHPRFRLRVGCRFRIALQAETTSQISAPNRDVLSRRGLWRKLRPGMSAQNGTRFPVRASNGNRVPVPASEWDAVSDRGMERKTRPGILGRYCRMKLIIRTLSFASNAAWMPRMVTSPPHSTGRNTCR